MYSYSIGWTGAATDTANPFYDMTNCSDFSHTLLAIYQRSPAPPSQDTTRANPGKSHHIHKQIIMIFIIDLTIKAEEKVLRLSQKPPKPRFRDAKIYNFPGGDPRPSLCFFFPILPGLQFRLRSAMMLSTSLL